MNIYWKRKKISLLGYFESSLEFYFTPSSSKFGSGGWEAEKIAVEKHRAKTAARPFSRLAPELFCVFQSVTQIAGWRVWKEGERGFRNEEWNAIWVSMGDVMCKIKAPRGFGLVVGSENCCWYIPLNAKGGFPQRQSDFQILFWFHEYCHYNYWCFNAGTFEMKIKDF